MCANGPLCRGTRVQTQWDEGAGHDNKWYCGTVEAVYMNGQAKIVYDDGDDWTGEAVYIYALPQHHPGMTQKFAIGAPTMEGVPGAGGLQMGGAVPMMAQPMMAQPMMAQPMMSQPMAQPSMQVMEVQCPPNAGPGSVITVQGPGGPMEVTVPQGTMPGMNFQFQVPGGPPQAMAQPAYAQPVMAQPVGTPQVVMGMPM